MNELPFEIDMEIDPDELDVAALEQANLHARYGRLSADADREATLADEELKTIRSKLIRKVSQDEDLLEGAKATAQNVEAYYRDHPKYIKAKHNWIEAKHRADLARGAIFSVQQRGRMLDLLVSLLKSEYFEAPVSPTNLSEKALKSRKKELVVDKARQTFKKYGRKIEEETEEETPTPKKKKVRRRRRV